MENPEKTDSRTQKRSSLERTDMDDTEDEALVTMSDEDYEAYLVGLLREIAEEAKKTKDLYMRITEIGRRVAKQLLELDPDILDKLEKEEDVEDN